MVKLLKNPFAILLSIVFVVTLIWNTKLQLTVNHATSWNFLYNAAYGIIYFASGLYGMFHGLKIGKTSPLSKTLLLVGLGLLSYGTALFIWVYYNLALQIEIPYPSLTDVFFVLFTPLVAIGFFLFVRFFKNLTTASHVRDAVIIFIFSSALIFYIVRPDLNAEMSAAQLFLTIFYPFGDVILLSLALLAIRIGVGRIQSSLLVLTLASILQTVGDTLFTTRTAQKMYWNGDISDLFYTLSAFAFGLALILIKEQSQTQNLST